MNASDETLKQQFQLLQEQQQKKLLLRKQRKEEKEKSEKDQLKESKSFGAFGVEDDLALTLADPPAPSSSIYSEELVNHLNDQLREMKDENGRLYKLLSERDFEIRQLKKKREEDRAAIAGGAGVASDAAATKIVELSKKVRELRAEVEAEKTKARQTQKKCRDLENKLRSADSEDLAGKGDIPKYSNPYGSPRDDKSLEQELKATQEKLRQTELKLSEQRNQVLSVKNELKSTQKVLANEVGEGVTVQSLLNATSGWRGRAQQILALQKKVTELKSQLQDRQSSLAMEDDLEAQFMGTSSSKRSTLDDRHQTQIKRLEKERREAQDKAANELKALEEEHAALKRKFDASKARNKVLSEDVKLQKQQVQKLLDKGKHDDELIEALMKQQERLKSMVEQNNKSQQEKEQSQSAKLRELSQKQQHDVNVVEQLKKIVAEKEQKLHSMEDEIQELRQRAQVSAVNAQMNAANALFERTLSRPGTATIVNPVVNDGMALHTPSPPQSRASNRSTSRQSQVNGDATDRERASSRKSVRPASSQPGLLSKEELSELQAQCQEYKSMYHVAEVERDKLLELVKLLQQREEAGQKQSQDLQQELAHHKKKNVQLEKQLGKTKLEQSQSAKGLKKSKSKQGTFLVGDDTSKTEDITPEEVEELQTNLAIQKDENEALKATLQSTLQAKEEDLNLYSQMMEETKKIFLQGLRQYRQQQS
ncbi:coiled-coil domain-containing protein 13-like [Lingula anatina]|uniref:Coiled-coil domain-containing protein 13-like n=1 Tax=Lingula anatina TaxID=7574 RepID=A0A1S3HKX8_LINAN|nr:coiled-coil domain-containing protein 13-like [Lingula anatina]|eukprot:XP_013386677.1 coiled-coil domain-containing protein 13-like [Lingula anatina]